jgi:hypothetical protein
MAKKMMPSSNFCLKINKNIHQCPSKFDTCPKTSLKLKTEILLKKLKNKMVARATPLDKMGVAGHLQNGSLLHYSSICMIV